MNLRAGQTLSDARRWTEAQSVLGLAREGSEKLRNVMAQSAAWEAIGTTFGNQNRVAEAAPAENQNPFAAHPR